jgi:membrane protein insertase Oxa1/YidC/SpoIIIJ
MNWIANFITWTNELIGNFGFTVIMFVCAAQIILIPFKIFANKNNAAKAACEPEIRKIRKKYNANQLGVSMDDAPHLAPEIKRMSHDERDEAMANEIDAVYKKHGYHLWTAWIPTVINLIFLIALWNGINQATPAGFFSIKFNDIINQASDADYTWNWILFLAIPAFSLVSNVVGTLSNVMKSKKDVHQTQSTIVSSAIGIALSMGLSVWIMTSISTSIAIALLTLYAWSAITSAIKNICTKQPAAVL